jgi:hypothetical protein
MTVEGQCEQAPTPLVMPAEAGIRPGIWHEQIPAFAGMTECVVSARTPSDVMPAQAGTHDKPPNMSCQKSAVPPRRLADFFR